MRVTAPLATLLTATALIGASPSLAQDLSITVELPRIATAGYHRPYVAVWLERPDQTPIRTLAVWYNQILPAGEGKDWLKDIRTWWRKGGRELRLPADGVSGATRLPGRHVLTFPAARLSDLPAGDYVLVVEAAREQGGREAVHVPFRRGPRMTPAQATGSTELGLVRIAPAR